MPLRIESALRHEFNILLRDKLVENGRQQCISDPCIYIFRTGTVFAMIAIYVDDIPAPAMMLLGCRRSKHGSSRDSKSKTWVTFSELMGMHITRDMFARTISLDQSKYLRDILAKHGMTDCKPSSMPMDPGFLSGLAHMDSPPLTGVSKDV
jgi:hypothetical protein